jgi:hypothetical protein
VLRTIVLAALLGLLWPLAGGIAAPRPARAAGDGLAAETGHTLSGPIRDAWEAAGGLWLFGYPISEPFAWRSETGETVVAQYFERARLEYHPSKDGTEYAVLGGRLGVDLTGDRDGEAAFRPVVAVERMGCSYFAATGHHLCAPFGVWWQREGGLPVFGYPISEPFYEHGYLVQYFERARFEHHPENAGSRWEVELGHLGRLDAERRDLLGQPAFAPVEPLQVTLRADATVYTNADGAETAGSIPSTTRVRVIDGPRYDRYLVASETSVGWIYASRLSWSVLSDPRQATRLPLAAFDGAVAREINLVRARAGAAIYDPRANRLYAGGVSGPIGGASLSKTLLMTVALRQEQQGGKDLRELLVPMIELSDDDAANEVWAAIGGQRAVAGFLAEAGIFGFDTPDPWDWGALGADAAGWATLFGLLGSGQLLDAERTAFALGLMEDVIPDHRWGISTAGEDRLSIGKNGWYPDEAPRYEWRVNSAGFLDVRSGPDGVAPLVVVVVSRYPGEDGQAWGVDLATRVADFAAVCAGKRWGNAALDHPDARCAAGPAMPHPLARLRMF